jgi:hypothetical protein
MNGEVDLITELPRTSRVEVLFSNFEGLRSQKMGQGEYIRIFEIYSNIFENFSN